MKGLFFLWKKDELAAKAKNGILLPELFWPTVKKYCSSYPEKVLKFKAEGKILRSLKPFVQTEKVHNNFW